MYLRFGNATKYRRNLRWFQSYVVAILIQIPGITTPLSHSIPLFLAILASQAIHELGHAIAANLHRVKPMALGLTVVFPGIPIAHVGLPNLHGRLTRIEQLRVVAAGVWHNACVLCLLYSIIFSGITRIFWADAHGLRITESNDSELARWFPPGAIIQSINDYPVHSMTLGNRTQVWQQFLNDDLRSTVGWCIQEQDWNLASTACCQNFQSNETCFIAKEPKCFNPTTVLRGSARCNQTCDGRCAQIASHESLAWIDLSYASDQEQIILRGPFDTVKKTIVVSGHRAARWLSTLGMGNAQDTIAYAMRLLTDWLLFINFTLGLLNMLPIGPLDGAEFLRLGLTEVYSRHYGDAGDTYQLETDLEEAQETPWAGQVQQVFLVCQAISVLLIVIAVATNMYRAATHIYLSL